jgi:hypothetical protein
VGAEARRFFENPVGGYSTCVELIMWEACKNCKDNSYQKQYAGTGRISVIITILTLQILDN